MKNFTYILLVVAQLFSANYLLSQSSRNSGIPFIKSFTSKEYFGDLQIWTCVQDKRGIMYFGDNSGIIEFDGNEWRRIATPKNAAVKGMTVDSLGRVYVGMVSNFGYLAPNSRGEMSYISISSKYLPKNQRNFLDIWQITTTSDGVYFLTKKHLYRYINKQIATIPISLENSRIMQFGSNIYLPDADKGLCLVNGYNLKSLNSTLKGYCSMIPYSKTKVLLTTRADKWLLYDFDANTIEKFYTSNDRFFVENSTRKVIRIDKDRFAVATKSGGIAIVANNGEILQIINTNSGMPNDYVYTIFLDKDNNLWACTANGIAKIDVSFPATIYDKRRGLDGYQTTSFCFNNTIYLGTLNGINYLSNKQSNSQGDNNCFISMKSVQDEIWAFKPINDRLMALGSLCIWEIKNNDAKAVAINSDVAHCFHKSSKFGNILFVGTRTSLDYINIETLKSNNKLNKKCVPLIPNLKKIRHIAEDKEGNLWLATEYDGIVYVRFNNNNILDYSVTWLDKKNGLPNLENLQTYNINNDIIVTSENGVLKPEFSNSANSTGSIQFKYSSIFGTSLKSNISSILKLGSNRYMITSSPSFIATIINNRIVLDTIGFNRIQTNYGISGASLDNSNVLNIINADAFIPYNFNLYKDYKKTYHTLIRSVVIGQDSILFGGNFANSNDYPTAAQSNAYFPVLNFEDNSIHFDFAAMCYEESQETEYQYILEGFNNNWSKWSKDNRAFFTNLSEGNYIFKVQAKNIYGTLSNIAEYRFQILPPWYRTWWAYLAYLILFLCLVRIIVKLYTKRLVKQNEHLEEIVLKRTEEIRLQKEEILEQATQLEQSNIELQQLNENLAERGHAIEAANTQLELQKIELEKYSDHLETLVEERTHELVMAMKEIEKTDKLKTEIIANMNHEIRTPLSFIKNAVALIRVFLQGNISDPDLEDTLDSLNVGVNRLTKTLELFADLSALKSGNYKNNIEAFNLRSVLDYFQMAYTKRIKEDCKGIIFTTTCFIEDAYVEADEQNVEKTIDFIIDNAIKFTDFGYVSVELKDTMDSKYIITIKDTGIGIADEYKEMLFEPFSQEDMSATRAYEGIGLSLALAWEYSQINNFKIRFESNKGEGTTFVLEFDKYDLVDDDE